MNRSSLLFVISLFVCNNGGATEISGRAGVESRLFLDNDQFQSSVFFEPELFWSWNNNKDTVLFKPFVRLDDRDSERSHVDIRELQWLHVGSDWELRTGIGKVYWGVSESQHLVDVINQTDFVESVDQEEKLGQPMVQLSLIRGWGNIDVFVMPYFRERSFGDSDARLQGSIPINTDNAQYESGRKEHHVDVALRWSHYVGNWDIGLSYFSGTSRDPNLIPEFDSTTGSLVLTPFYPQVDQLGVDIQATLGSWLWKFEAINRDGLLQNYAAMTVGFEYTLVGVFESTLDLGLLMEFNRDSRGLSSPAPFQKDVFSGGRLTFNDAQSTEILFGASIDLDNSHSVSGLVEASRRIGNNWKISVDVWVFNSSTPGEPNFVLRNDDFASISFDYFY